MTFIPWFEYHGSEAEAGAKLAWSASVVIQQRVLRFVSGCRYRSPMSA